MTVDGLNPVSSGPDKEPCPAGNVENLPAVQDKPKGKYYGGGAQKKEIDYHIFEELCKICCTEEEICSILGVSVTTLTARIKEHYFDEETGEPLTFRDVYKRYSNYGIASLRREQFASAINRQNTTMQVWLGKQYLGQRDKFDATSGGASIRPVQILVENPQTAVTLQETLDNIARERADTLKQGAAQAPPVSPDDGPPA
jgi:hypothetical protein